MPMLTYASRCMPGLIRKSTTHEEHYSYALYVEAHVAGQRIGARALTAYAVVASPIGTTTTVATGAAVVGVGGQSGT